MLQVFNRVKAHVFRICELSTEAGRQSRFNRFPRNMTVFHASHLVRHHFTLNVHTWCTKQMISLLEMSDKNKGTCQAVIHRSHNGSFSSCIEGSVMPWSEAHVLANIIAPRCSLTHTDLLSVHLTELALRRSCSFVVLPAVLSSPAITARPDWSSPSQTQALLSNCYHQWLWVFLRNAFAWAPIQSVQLFSAITLMSWNTPP